MTTTPSQQWKKETWLGSRPKEKEGGEQDLKRIPGLGLISRGLGEGKPDTRIRSREGEGIGRREEGDRCFDSGWVTLKCMDLTKKAAYRSRSKQKTRNKKDVD